MIVRNGWVAWMIEIECENGMDERSHEFGISVGCLKEMDWRMKVLNG